MKDFNLHKFLRDNPLTNQTKKLSKGKINEAFEGFGGVKGVGAIGVEVRKRPKDFDTNQDPWGWDKHVAQMRDDEENRTNKWIMDIDRMPDYNGWKASWEYPGIISWSHADVPTATVVATPGWDGPGTPVEFQSEAGSSQMLKVLDQDVFPTFKAYLNAVRPYLDMVLDANVNPTSTDHETSDIKAPGMEEGYMGTPYDSSEDMSVDMLKKGVREAGMGMSTLFVMDYQSGKMFSKMVPEEMQSEEIEDMLADEYGMNPSDIYYMITKNAEVEDLDDANLMENDYFNRRRANMSNMNKTINNFISGDDDEEEMPNRIEGLVNQRELAKFADAVMAIAQDLDDDGFDAVDIKKLLKDKLDDMIIA
jgi:hypothetical protein